MPSIQQMQQHLNKLDTYSQLSVLGSWSFIANSACINQAMRYVPDEPVDNGIESFTPYEAARRHLMTEAEQSKLPSIIALQRDIQGWVYEADGNGRGLEDTLQFMTENAPKRESFGAEYDNRVRLGMKPAMSRRQFIDYEYERAISQHNKLVARGEDAVRLCDTVTIDNGRGYGDLPDWVTESFERKLIEKLHSRWEKLELVRSNPRRTKQVRDSAQADQLMLERVLAEFGEQPGFQDDDITEAQMQAQEQPEFPASASDLSTLGGPDYSKAYRVPKETA